MIPRPMIYLVVRDSDERQALAAALDRAGYEVSAYVGAEQLLSSLSRNTRGCVVTELAAGKPAKRLLDEIYDRSDRVTVVLIAEASSVDEAVSALREGAADYLTRPIDPQTLVERVNDALDSGLFG